MPKKYPQGQRVHSMVTAGQSAFDTSYGRGGKTVEQAEANAQAAFRGAHNVQPLKDVRRARRDNSSPSTPWSPGGRKNRQG